MGILYTHQIHTDQWGISRSKHRNTKQPESRKPTKKLWISKSKVQTWGLRRLRVHHQHEPGLKMTAPNWDSPCYCLTLRIAPKWKPRNIKNQKEPKIQNNRWKRLFLPANEAQSLNDLQISRIIWISTNLEILPAYKEPKRNWIITWIS